MLTEHPYIERIRIEENLAGATVVQRLIIETNLTVPESGDFSGNPDLQALKEFLTLLAKHDFADFQDIEIREYKPRPANDRYAA